MLMLGTKWKDHNLLTATVNCPDCDQKSAQTCVALCENIVICCMHATRFCYVLTVTVESICKILKNILCIFLMKSRYL